MGGLVDYPLIDVKDFQLSTGEKLIVKIENSLVSGLEGMTSAFKPAQLRCQKNRLRDESFPNRTANCRISLDKTNDDVGIEIGHVPTRESVESQESRSV